MNLVDYYYLLPFGLFLYSFFLFLRKYFILPLSSFSKMNCPLCNSDHQQLFSNLKDLEYNCGETFNFSECTKCSFVCLNPTPSQESLNSFYPSNYHGFNTQSNFVIKNLYKLVNHFRLKNIQIF